MMEEVFGREEPGEVEEHSITMRNNQVTITVKPLPKIKKPAGFKGAVGKFTMQAELKNKTIASGEFNISGFQNLGQCFSHKNTDPISRILKRLRSHRA